MVNKNDLLASISKYNTVYTQITQIRMLLEQYKQQYLQEFEGDLIDIEKEKNTKSASASAATEANCNNFKFNSSAAHMNDESPPPPPPPQASPNDPMPVNNMREEPPPMSPEIVLPKKQETAFANLKRLVDTFYTKLCRQFHPDRPTGDETKFLRLQEDYEKQNVAGIVHLGLTILDNNNITELVKDDEIVPLHQNIEKECSKLTSEIRELMSTLPWIWGNAVEQERPYTRLRIVRKLREQLY